MGRRRRWTVERVVVALRAAAGTVVVVLFAALAADTDLDHLDADLDAPPHERREWLDEQEPHAAGDPVRDRPC